jgi:hypothetical protein
MPNRLQPLNLTDFTGGLNLRTNQFQLAENESPDLLNFDIDPRGGFYTRRGWQRWNEEDIIDVTAEGMFWKPRNAFVHIRANGDQYVNVVNDHKIYWAGTDAVFAELTGVVADAEPHGADFVAWGDVVYVACGMFQPTIRLSGSGLITPMDPDNWSEVVEPIDDTVPCAEYVAAHAGYLFVAATNEADGNHFARVRWSHPDKPDAFRVDDYLDIDSGGGRITGIMSFRDHLLIFKTNSLWALYGYDEDSWQLIKVSMSVGCPSITAATRSETAVFFFSASDKGGIYAYNGENPVYLSENLRPAFEQIIAFQNVFVSWAGRRLWVGVPWNREVGSVPDLASTFVFDPDIGEGAWTMYSSRYGTIGPVIDGSDVYAHYPMSAFWSNDVAIMVSVDIIDDAYDSFFETPVLGANPPYLPEEPAWLMTTGGAEIEVNSGLYRGQPFDSYYRTRWLHADWPDRKKSWRRPTFVCRQVPMDTELLVETFRDYNETTVHRTRTLYVRADGASYWREAGYTAPEDQGFDWKELGAASPDGRGADWKSERRGSVLMRAGSMGLACSIQMRVRASPNTPLQKWGVDGIVAKYVPRRFR